MSSIFIHIDTQLGRAARADGGRPADRPGLRREGEVSKGWGGGVMNRSLENRCWVVGPRRNRSLSAADAAFVRGSDHRWRRLRSRHRTRRRARRFSLMPMSRRVMGAPSKIAVGLWGREGTAHFRRLTPPSFAARNPRHCDARPQHGIVDAVGCSHRASAMGNRPRQGAAIFIDADVP
jgi:hypothetical protein